MDKPPKTMRLSKKRILLITIAVFLFFAVILPLFWPDASGNYTGVKKEAAIYAVSNAWSQSSGINYATIAGTIKISAESVAVADSTDKLCNGEFTSQNDLSLGDHFLVTIDYRTLFGIVTQTATIHICRAH